MFLWQAEWERVRSEESRRQRLERKALDQQSKALAKLPTRKERGEVRAPLKLQGCRNCAPYYSPTYPSPEAPCPGKSSHVVACANGNQRFQSQALTPAPSTTPHPLSTKQSRSPYTQ